MKKNDFILFAVIILIAALFWGFNTMLFRDTGGKVMVSIGGAEYKTYSLSEDQEIELTGLNGKKNLLVISDGKADIIEADCPDELCVNQKSISKVGEMLVCLPNEIVVEVVSGDKQDIDVIAK